MDQVSHHPASVAEPSTRERLERVVEAGQRMISSRFDLLSLELKQTMSGALKTGVLTSIGAVILLLGYIAAMIAIAFAIALALPAWAAVLIVAGIQFVLGGTAALIGRTQTYKPKLAISPEEEQHVQRRLPSPTTGRPGERAPSRPLIYRPQGT